MLLPGGFSYGDYLRTGSIARFSPIMNSVISFANEGGIVIGICNGFQLLLEAGLLPGVMIRNKSLKFACKNVYLKVENRETIFSSEISEDKKVVKIPIAHGEGNYFADEELLKELKANNQIVFKYADSNGNITDGSNPNGSQINIAGIVNNKGNVFGMMPHPERACDPTLGRTDGTLIFKSIANYILN
jgi:phosphoribosylformylglycinamidine synthase